MMIDRSGHLACRRCAPATSRPLRSRPTTRLAGAPDIPTVDEAGLPGFHVSLWHGAVGCRRARRRTSSPGSMPRWSRRLADPAVRAKLRRSRPGHLAARTADAGGARRPAQGRDREMVADHQGGRHQGASSRLAHRRLVQLPRSGGIKNEIRRSRFWQLRRCAALPFLSCAAHARKPIRRGRCASFVGFPPAAPPTSLRA